LTADYQNETAEPKADTITEIDPGAGFVWSGIPFGASGPPYDERFLPPNPFVTYATYSDPRSGLTFRPETEYESRSASARADWGITDGIDMALILAYADITSTLVSDADGSPINVQSTSGVQTIDYTTVELRFSGRAFDRMDWTVGGFYYDGESVNNQIVSIPFLSFILDGQDAVADRDAVHGQRHQAARALPGDDFEMIGLAADHHAQRDKGVISAALRRQRDRPGQLQRARHANRLVAMSRRLDRRPRPGQQHVIEMRVEARLGDQDMGHLLLPAADAAFLDDRQPIGREAHRRMARVRQQHHVMDAERGQDLRTDAISPQRLPALRRLARP